MLFPSTLELELRGHELLEIYRETHSAMISFLESFEKRAEDVTSTDVILEKILYNT